MVGWRMRRRETDTNGHTDCDFFGSELRAGRSENVEALNGVAGAPGCPKVVYFGFSTKK